VEGIPMALPDKIRSLRDRVMADLNAAYDYFTHSQIAWRIVHNVVQAGSTFTIKNSVTGTETTHESLLNKSQGYVAKELAEATFQQFISIFESFVFDLLHQWLMAYPQNLIAKKVDYKVILDAPDKESITTHVVNREVNEVMYERPSNWFAYLEEKAKLGCPTVDEIEQIAEAKAARDVLVHNRGVANKIYELKAGKFARYKDGQPIDIPDPYHHQIWELLRKVVDDVSNAALAKFP
jgi:hypothetical protein